MQWKSGLRKYYSNIPITANEKNSGEPKINDVDAQYYRKSFQECSRYHIDQWNPIKLNICKKRDS